MRRVSSIRSSRQAELEKRREELRDIRWVRRRSKLITAVSVAYALTFLATDASENVFRVLRGLLGV